MIIGDNNEVQVDENPELSVIHTETEIQEDDVEDDPYHNLPDEDDDSNEQG